MIEQMTAKGLDVSHEGFKYYLQAFKYGLPQHGGCGFGVAGLFKNYYFHLLGRRWVRRK
jgi:aspartyl/asparaginyl-tRNA synthetase